MKQSNIQPLFDRILIQRIDEPQDLIVIPDIAKTKSFKGKVLAVGLGKRIPGEWWFVKQPDGSRKWEWIESTFQPIAYRAGQIVAFNSRWDDLSEGYEKGHSERDGLHLVQEADVIGTIGN